MKHRKPPEGQKIMKKSRQISLGMDYETEWHQKGFRSIAGIDEVGRGPLAGPVIAAAVILPLHNIPEGLNDSKQLSAKRREELFDQIMELAHIGIASVPPSLIDSINIRQASLLAMRQAFSALEEKPDMALVDGRDMPDLPCKTIAIIKGDSKIASIAAASIIAKVTRDRLMKNISTFFPEYFFEKNAGYGVEAHRAALEKYGPTHCHRFTFSPVRQKTFNR